MRLFITADIINKVFDPLQAFDFNAMEVAVKFQMHLIDVFAILRKERLVIIFVLIHNSVQRHPEILLDLLNLRFTILLSSYFDLAKAKEEEIAILLQLLMIVGDNLFNDERLVLFRKVNILFIDILVHLHFLLSAIANGELVYVSFLMISCVIILF